MVDTAIARPIVLPDAEAKEEKSNMTTSNPDAPAATEADVAQKPTLDLGDDKVECGASDNAPSASCSRVTTKSAVVNRPARVSISNDEGSASAERATPTPNNEEDGKCIAAIATVVSRDDSTVSTEKTVDSTNTVATGTETTAPFVVKSDEVSNAVPKKRKASVQASKKLVKGPIIAPKKNKTAFMHFSIYARHWTKINIPKYTGTELTKYVRENWDGMDKSSRDYWDGIAEKDKARYEKDLEEHKHNQYLAKLNECIAATVSQTDSGKKEEVDDPKALAASASTAEVGEDDTKQSGAKSNLKDPADQSNVSEKVQVEEEKAEDNVIDVPKTAFMHYEAYASNYIKSRQPYVKDVQVMDAVYRGWNVMSKKERTYWEEKAAAELAKYQKEVATYTQQGVTSHSDEGVTEIDGVKVAFL